ncbi:MAG: apolipoprotein N-acyltransferase [Betaproteobacteria bacterium]|nr:apolipoprotein N-acyltransferase [Betaproteobacteria bacterium]
MLNITRAPGILLIAFCLGLGSVPAYSAGDTAGFVISLLPIAFLALFYLLLLRANGGKRAFLMGFAYGLGLFLGGVSWVYVSLADFAAMPVPLAMLLTLLFCAYLALFPALFAFLFNRLTRSAPEFFITPFVFAGCLTLAELLRGLLFTGFPWLALGYSQADSPLSAYAGIVGVYGISFIGALIAAWLATAHRRNLLPLVASLLLWFGGMVLAQIEWTKPEGEHVSAALIQGNVPQSLKWQPEQFAETLSLYHDLIIKNPAQLVLLPETAFPDFVDRLPRDYLETLQNTLQESDGDLLFGAPVREGGARYYNSAVSLGASPSQQYAKRHLVPFGEFIPFGFNWFLRLADIPLADFSAGKRGQPPLAIAKTRVAVSICYEDLFGEETLDFLPEAALLVNLSNTAWFGDSLAPGQHLQIARMRAIETGRPVLRAGNTGVTALITPKGEVAAQLPTFTRAVLRVETQGYVGLTPFVRVGNWPAILLTIVSCLLPFLVRPNRR